MPKTYGDLWPRIIDIDNIYRAYLAARDKKREKPEVLAYDSHREENLITAHNELVWHMWKPRPFREFIVYEPKKRLIHAPQFSDRVIHHALVRVIEPLFERKMISNSFACRKGLGTHKAVSTAQKYARAVSRSGRFWFLKGDIHHYFPSIDHEALKKIIRRTVRDKDTLWLIDTIIDESGFPGVGLPIGTLTSQLFANIYLDAFDHYMKDILGIRHYLRYMDDFIVFGNNKSELKGILTSARQWLKTNLNLTLNHKTRIISDAEGCDFCGYRIWTTHTLPRKRNVRRMHRRLRRMARLYFNNKVDIARIQQVVASYLGYMQHCCGYRTTAIFLEEFILRHRE